MAKATKKANILDIVKDIVQFKASCEANIVGCLWKKPDLYDTYDSLGEDNFHKEVWKMFFKVGKEIYQGENKKVLDDLTVGLYLEKHKSVKEIYLKHGGYKTIDELKGFVQIGNLDGYIEELTKWDKVLQLHKMNFPIEHIIDKIKETSLDELYNMYEAQINHIFMDTTSGSVKSHNVCEGIDELIDECNKGNKVGFPILPPMLNEEINGLSVGNITLLGAGSGVGKTTTTIEWIFPNMIEYNEQVVMVINEQDEVKMRQELLTWVANNIFNANFNKKRLRQGKFTDAEMKMLRKCSKWIQDKKDNKNITVIPLQRYTVQEMTKIIKKYAAMGVKYFILDTFKESDDSTEESWLSMMKNMRSLYDVIKPAGKNVHLFVTVQLTKNLGHKYLTQSSIGMSKNIVDVCSAVLLMRKVQENEKDSTKGLQVYKMAGTSGKTKVPVKLEEDKQYIIIFLDKNREGSAGAYQIVAEQDLSRNVFKEVGITITNQDY